LQARKIPKTHESDQNLELNFGIKVLSRIGIIAILIGLTLALHYSFQNFFNKEIKLLTGFILSVLTFWGGLQLSQHHKLLGRTLQAGAVSLGYITTYAAFFFKSTKLFEADQLGYLCLFIYIALAMLLAQRLKSSLIAALSFGFGYYTAFMVAKEQLLAWSYIPCLILNLSALALSWYRPLWKKINLICLLGSALVYFDSSYAEAHYRLAFACTNFAIFQLATFLKVNSRNHIFLIINNLLFWLIYYSGASDLGRLGTFEFVLAGINLLSYFIYLKQGRQRDLAPVALSCALFFLICGTAIFFQLDNHIAILVLLMQAIICALLTKYLTKPSIYHIFSALFLTASLLELIYLNQSTKVSLPKLTIAIDAGLIAGTTLLLNHRIYRHQLDFKGFSNWICLLITNLALLIGLQAILPDQQQTFIFLGLGVFFWMLGFLQREIIYRYNGLLYFLLASLNLLLRDISELDTLLKILIFVVFGICLIMVSYLYSKLEKNLSERKI
jgi:CDP-diglyceride synthetase